MKTRTLIAAILAVVAPVAFAQAKLFEGFSLGANLDASQTTTNVVGLGSDSGNTNGFGFQAQYSIAYGNQFVLGLGGSLSTGSRKAGTLGPSDFSVKNATSLDISPGYALSESLLVYGKLSALSLTAVGSTTATGNEFGSESLTGIGYGIGVRSMIDKNIYIQAGYDSNRFNEKSSSGGFGTFSGSSNVFSLGAGYKF
jgi:outer membrane immunogenic protein